MTSQILDNASVLTLCTSQLQVAETASKVAVFVLSKTKPF